MIGFRRLTQQEHVAARRVAAATVWSAWDSALNVLAVYWLSQLAFPALGLLPPTLLGAAGLAGLAMLLRRGPLRISDWARR